MGNRKDFIRTMSLGIGALSTSTSLIANTLDSLVGKPENNKKTGIALLGLGNYSTDQLAPALQKTNNCYLAGIVTGTPSKIAGWKKKYNIKDENVYNYENFHQIKDNKDIDVVYVVTPNSLHAKYTIMAAEAKKHVICEKPMATSVEDAQKMLDACEANGVGLSIGYRLHYEPFNKRIMEIGQNEIFGEVKEVKAVDSSDMTSGKPDVWRLNKELAGGGPLMDLGIYCVQGVCYTLGDKPVAVRATFGEVTKPTYFYDVEESIAWEMEFQNGPKAECRCSYSEKGNELSGKAENGWWKLSPAYAYEGKKGETSKGKMDFPNTYEQVDQMDAQVASFNQQNKSITSGEMGLRDMKILMAIYKSAENGGQRVSLKW